MTPEQQAGILAVLLNRIQNEMLAAIEAGKVPEEWGGIEIRAWLLDKTACECRGGVFDRLLVGKRYKAFHNELIVRNL